MNMDQQGIEKILKDFPPHFWNQCGLSVNDLPVISRVMRECEHKWNEQEKREIDMLIKRIREERSTNVTSEY